MAAVEQSEIVRIVREVLAQASEPSTKSLPLGHHQLGRLSPRKLRNRRRTTPNT